MRGRNGPGLVRAARSSISGTSPGPSRTVSPSDVASTPASTSCTPSPTAVTAQPPGGSARDPSQHYRRARAGQRGKVIPVGGIRLVGQRYERRDVGWVAQRVAAALSEARVRPGERRPDGIVQRMRHGHRKGTSITIWPRA